MGANTVQLKPLGVHINQILLLAVSVALFIGKTVKADGLCSTQLANTVGKAILFMMKR